jgi:hypothetical protein
VPSTAAPTGSAGSVGPPLAGGAAAIAPPPAAAGAGAGLPLMRPFPVVRVAGRVTGHRTTLTLVFVRAPRDSRIAMDCAGTSCAFVHRERAGGRARLRSLERSFAPGTVIEIRVWRRGFAGRHVRLRTRLGRPPSRVDRCVTSARAPPTTCPPR